MERMSFTIEFNTIKIHIVNGIYSKLLTNFGFGITQVNYEFIRDPIVQFFMNGKNQSMISFVSHYENKIHS